MERLTARNEEGKAYYPYCFREDTCGGGCAEHNGICEFSEKVCERLAAYEDLDITPEQVRELDRICTEKIQELLELQKQIPTCKVGDTIWDIDFGKPHAYKITGYSFGTAEDYIDEPVTEEEIVYYYVNLGGSITGSFSASEMGKSVFLTREEAEQALAEMKGE